MKLFKTGLLTGVVLVGSAISVQASEPVHTYEQTAHEAYASFQNTASQQTFLIQQEMNRLSEAFMRDIEAEFPSADDMDTEKVRDEIAAYKDDYIKAVQDQKQQVTENMFTTYEQNKQEHIQEAITDDITDFLEDITK